MLVDILELIKLLKISPQNHAQYVKKPHCTKMRFMNLVKSLYYPRVNIYKSEGK